MSSWTATAAAIWTTGAIGAAVGYARHEILGRHVWTIARDPDVMRLSVLRRLQSASPRSM